MTSVLHDSLADSNMDSFVRKLLTEWRRLGLPFDSATALIAVSGGADSISLALAMAELKRLKKLGLQFVIAHYNHNLRGAKSDKDQKMVESLAAALGMKFVTDKAKSLSTTSKNLEEMARNLRYIFLEKAAKKNSARIVLLGHTLDDQAETFLLRLLRGSGGDGLGAMRPKRPIAENSDIELARPLLTWARRKDTEGFCRKKKVTFVVDEMNNDPRFERVRVRKELVPLLESFNPRIVENLSDTANLLQSDSDELNLIAQGLFDAASRKKRAVIDASRLRDANDNIRRRVLRVWIKENMGGLRRVSQKHITAIESLLFTRKSGRIAELPGGCCVIKRGGNLVFEKTRVEKTPRAN